MRIVTGKSAAGGVAEQPKGDKNWRLIWFAGDCFQ
jgi:hypothetical protein